MSRNQIQLRAKNIIAEQLLQKLDSLNAQYTSGYFGGTNYCIGVHIKNVADACTLGIELGKNDWGLITFDHFPNIQQPVVVFRDAAVGLA